MAATPDALIRQWFEELWNQGREDTIDRLLSPTALVHGLPTPDGQPIVGREPFKTYYRRFREAFPDIHITIDRTVTEGNYVAVVCHVTGTHLGDNFGKPATRKPVAFSGMCIVKASGGQLVEGWNCFDFLTCYQQIGLVQHLGG